MEKYKKELIELVPYIIVLIVIIIVKHFLFAPIVVNGDSMYPTLHNRDIMILDKISLKTSKINRFDIVVVKIPGERLIKRVVGLPGEKIEYKDNKFYVNGKEVKDKYNKISQSDFSITLEKEEYFVLGDNRGNSVDSRILGPIHKSGITGKATYTIFPFNRLGKK